METPAGGVTLSAGALARVGLRQAHAQRWGPTVFPAIAATRASQVIVKVFRNTADSGINTTNAR